MSAPVNPSPWAPPPSGDAVHAAPPGYVPAPPAAPPALPDQPRDYYGFYRAPRHRWWRDVLALLMFGALFGIIQIFVSILIVIVHIAQGGEISTLATTLTWPLFLLNNLSLIALIPAAMLTQWACYGQRPRWLSSVEGGFRWRWLGRTLLITGPAFVVYGVLNYLVDVRIEQTVGTMIAMLIVVLVTTPLQSAGEEYGFRGLVPRAIAGLIPHRPTALVVAALVSGTVFASVHFAADPWLISYYFLFGLVAFVVAWRTGGVEASISLHAGNNTILLLVSSVTGSWTQTFDRGEGTGGPFILVPAAFILAIGLGLILLARHDRVVRIAAPATPDAPVAQAAPPAPHGSVPPSAPPPGSAPDAQAGPDGHPQGDGGVSGT